MTINVSAGAPASSNGLPAGGSAYQSLRNIGAGLGAWGAPAIIDPTLPPFNADPTGTSDAYAALTAAIGALPSAGGLIVPPPASVFKLNTGLSIAKSGVVIDSFIPPGGGGSGLAPRLFAGASMNTLVTVTSTGSTAIVGAGLKGLILDGSSNVTGDALQLFGSEWGNFDDLAVFGPQGGGCISTGTTVIGPNSMHNKWGKIYVLPGTTNGSYAVIQSGNFTNTASNSCYDNWNDLTIAWQSAASGRTITGIWFQAADNIRMRNLHFYGVAPVGANNALLYDYSGVTAGWPADCNLENVDFGGTSVTVANLGTPSGATPNRVVGISATNGIPATPSLANLKWGYSNANP